MASRIAVKLREQMPFEVSSSSKEDGIVAGNDEERACFEHGACPSDSINPLAAPYYEHYKDMFNVVALVYSKILKGMPSKSHRNLLNVFSIIELSRENDFEPRFACETH